MTSYPMKYAYALYPSELLLNPNHFPILIHWILDVIPLVVISETLLDVIRASNAWSFDLA